VGLKNAYSSSLNWLYWWKEGAEGATHRHIRWRRGTFCTFQLGLIVIYMWCLLELNPNSTCIAYMQVKFLQFNDSVEF
jgi:hypothetical protein